MDQDTTKVVRRLVDMEMLKQAITKTRPHLPCSGMVPNKLPAPRPRRSHQTTGPRGHKSHTRGIYKNAEWCNLAKAYGDEMARINKDHTKQMLSDDGEDGIYQARYTVCSLCQRQGDTPATQSWLAGNREHIHLACKHPKIQATRSAFATLVENAIKDLCQLIKTRLGEARFEQLTDNLTRTLRKTEQDLAQRMEQQCCTTQDQQTAATAEHVWHTDTRRIRTRADRKHLHVEATQGTNGNLVGQHGTYSKI
jgi:hypothetical protein